MSESSNKSIGIDHGPPVSSGPGWNDIPDALFAIAKKKQAKQATASVASTMTVNAITSPITQPLAQGGGMPEPEQHPPPMGGPGSNLPPPPPMNYGFQQPQQNYYGGGAPQNTFEAPPPPAPAPGNLMNPYQQQPSQPQNTGYTGFQPQPMGYQPMTPQPPQQAAQQPPRPETPPPEPPQPVQKGPIPADHQILQEVFDGLKNRCLAASNHPQHKRKLMEVSKKLDVLYDKLRDNSLPPNVTTSLHQLVQYIWSFDYNSCLQVINQMVSGGSFTLLAEFLPGVKVLIQVASQLGVYVERPQ